MADIALARPDLSTLTLSTSNIKEEEMMSNSFRTRSEARKFISKLMTQHRDGAYVQKLS